MHRSGTSLCAHVLHALGVDMTDTPDPVPSNPKGQWERLEIVGLHDRVLELFGRGYFTPLHDLALPPGWPQDPRLAPIRRELAAYFAPRLAQGAAIGFKDPRTCRLLPLWRDVIAGLDVDAKFVLCLRHPVQVARSLDRRDGLPPDSGEYRWFSYMADVVGQLRDETVCTIEYEDWFADPAGNAAKLAAVLDLPAGGSPPELAAAIAPIVDRGLSHDDPALGEPRLPGVSQLYAALRRIDVDPAARAEARRIADSFAAFQALHQPVEREFEALSRAVLALPQLAGEAAAARLRSFRGPAAAAAFGRLAEAAPPGEPAGEAASLKARLDALLKQRAELDAALARAQQAAALRERETAALQRRLDAPDPAPAGAENADDGRTERADQAPVRVHTPVPAGRALPPAVVPELIETIVARRDGDLIDRMIALHGDDREFCGALAVRLFAAGIVAAARRAAAMAARAATSGTRPPGPLLADALQTPILFRHAPFLGRGADLILWYRPMRAGAGAAEGALAVRVRWFDAAGRVLVWDSRALYLDLGGDRPWQPLAVPPALWPRGDPWLRFEIHAEAGRRRLSLCTGFVFAADWATEPDAEDDDVLALATPSPPLLPPGAPWETPVAAAGESDRVVTRTPRPARRGGARVRLRTDAVGGAEILFFVDWDAFGRPLAAAQMPDAALPPATLVLPAGGPDARIFGWAAARGFFPVVAAAAPDRPAAPTPAFAAG